MDTVVVIYYVSVLLYHWPQIKMWF